ncbi:MAG TPA: hypothetical protein VFJ72_12345 [Rubrobacteraceae bacterium]|nr:hypothetical protein [Rubrobacteraceae bacterium]
MSLIELVLALAAILAAAALFTNAIEILGERLNLGEGAVGSVLAAVGTALPETMIPLIAIFGALIFGGDAAAAGEIGVGAILGAPFLLATLAMFVAGVAAYGYRRRRGSGREITMERATAIRDLGFFLVFYTIAAGVGVLRLPFLLKLLVVVVLIAAYVLYVLRTLKAEGGTEGEAPSRLTLWPKGSAPTWAVVAQVVGSLVVMAAGAHFFVDAVEHGSKALGIPAGLIALILAPLATELPEKVNSVLWLKNDKDTLALGNITGAMVFQSTIPVSLGIAFTPWVLEPLNLLSVVLALISGGLVFYMLRRSKPIQIPYLLAGGALYGVFVIAAVFNVVFL